MATSTPAPPRLSRPTQGRLLAGVCRAVADHIGIDVMYVRLAFVFLGFASGAGIDAYLFLWAVTPVDEPSATVDPARPQPAASARPHSGAIPRGVVLLAIGVLVTLAGAVTLLQTTGRDVRSGLLLPVLLIAIGAVVAWAQLDASQRARWAGVTGWSGFGMARLGMGLTVVILGLLALSTRGQSFSEAWDVALATLSILIGAALILLPFAVRFWTDFRREQDARVGEAARADIAAPLHDGVLQTLALIQRGADDPAYVTQLARKQERELRGWLYGSDDDPSQTLAAAVAAVAAEVEDLHGVPVDAVITGDRPLDAGGRTITRALREALLNAVRHGSPPVSAYVEIGPEAVEAFVRDHGAGFDPGAVPEDRLGVKESIIGRMRRHGGTAEVRRRDPGTEIILSMPHDVDTAAAESGDGHGGGTHRIPEPAMPIPDQGAAQP